jgi:hypothetical protein
MIDIRHGSWTPVLTFATPGNLAVTYTNQVGRYVRHRELVTIFGTIVTASFTHTTASGDLQVTGIPYPHQGGASGFMSVGAVIWGGITKANYTQVNARIAAALPSIVDFNASGSGVAAGNVLAANMPTGGTVVLIFTITYPAT